MPKRILEESWPHGTKARTVVEDQSKLIKYIALGANNAGLLDGEDPVGATIEALRDLVRKPALLAQELKKMGKQGGRAARTFRQVRKEL